MILSVHYPPERVAFKFCLFAYLTINPYDYYSVNIYQLSLTVNRRIIYKIIFPIGQDRRLPSFVGKIYPLRSADLHHVV
jgi:hypothetical protein